MQARFAAVMSYGQAGALLGGVFPLGRALHAAGVREQTYRVAARLDDELGPEDTAGFRGRAGHSVLVTGLTGPAESGGERRGDRRGEGVCPPSRSCGQAPAPPPGVPVELPECFLAGVVQLIHAVLDPLIQLLARLAGPVERVDHRWLCPECGESGVAAAG
jgi:hypothetical protein